MCVNNNTKKTNSGEKLPKVNSHTHIYKPISMPSPHSHNPEQGPPSPSSTLFSPHSKSLNE